MKTFAIVFSLFLCWLSEESLSPSHIYYLTDCGLTVKNFFKYVVLVLFADLRAFE